VTDRKKVAKSFNRYLEHQSRERDELRRTLEKIASRLEETVIFGGMIREFALGNTRSFRSDIDIVSQSTATTIFDAIKDYCPSKNKFGGYRFTVGTQLFDIWSFEDTWAFKTGIVEGSSLSDIFKTTFFNMDAAVFHLGKRKLLCSDFYIDALRSRVLDLNLQENPSPSGMARRAIRLAVGNELLVTPRLGEYILENIDIDVIDDISKTYVKHLKSFLSEGGDKNFSFSPQKCLFPPNFEAPVSDRGIATTI
jgi:hypothetical protein